MTLLGIDFGQDDDQFDIGVRSVLATCDRAEHDDPHRLGELDDLGGDLDQPVLHALPS